MIDFKATAIFLTAQRDQWKNYHHYEVHDFSCGTLKLLILWWMILQHSSPYPQHHPRHYQQHSQCYQCSLVLNQDQDKTWQSIAISFPTTIANSSYISILLFKNLACLRWACKRKDKHIDFKNLLVTIILLICWTYGFQYLFTFKALHISSISKATYIQHIKFNGIP